MSQSFRQRASQPAGASPDGAPLPLAGTSLDVAAALRGKPLRILMVASESTPFIKTGGMADVVGALPRALHKLGHDVRVVLPRYKVVDPERWHLSTLAANMKVPMNPGMERVNVLEAEQRGGVRVDFIDAPHYFQRDQLYGHSDDGERYILFSRAALELTRAIDWEPDIIHCHDWQTAIIPNWTKTLLRDNESLSRAATVYTIHNLAFQGIFGHRILEVAGVAEDGFLYPQVPELADVVDLMGRGILFADVINTVSPRYAREILTPPFGARLDPLLRERNTRLYGILNGIDTEEFNPETDNTITARFDALDFASRPLNKHTLQERCRLPVRPDVPLLCMISRLVREKGFDLMDHALIPLLDQGVQMVIAGTGDQQYHDMLQAVARRYPEQLSVQFTFNDALSRAIYAGSDMLLMPSAFEPCGVTQMLAMRYGCIPIVHLTGGLVDTVHEYDPATGQGNGFTFARYDHYDLFAAVVRAVQLYARQPAIWHNLMQQAMSADFSWDASAENYVALYRRAAELHAIDGASA
jgi:starch synthase